MIEPIIDISYHQGEMEKESTLSAGTLGLMIRVGLCNDDGDPYTDERFYENAEKFAHDIPCGYYWFFEPEHSGLVQAEYLLDLMSQVKRSLPIALDVEKNDRKLSKARFQAELKAACDLLYDATGERCVIYTRGMFWNYHVGNSYWASKHKLWIARYNSSISHPWNNDPSSMYRPLPWDDYWMWQWSADKPANLRGREFGAKGSQSIDINRCNMTHDEFNEFANWKLAEGAGA